MGRGPKSPGRKDEYPARGRRQPCQPAQAPGTPGGIGPPPPLLVGPGAKSDPGPWAGGDLQGWVGPGRAWQDTAPERLGGAGPGGRGGPGAGGWGWSGLAVGGPGAPWDLADTRAPGSWLGAQGHDWPHPFLCPYMGVGDDLGTPSPSQAQTPACCHGDQDPLPCASPSVGLMESSPDCQPPRLPAGTAGGTIAGVGGW